jgi:TonB family protein
MVGISSQPSTILRGVTAAVLVVFLSCAPPAEQASQAPAVEKSRVEEGNASADSATEGDESPLRRHPRLRRPPEASWTAVDWAGEAAELTELNERAFSRPELKSGDRPRYTDEARRARVQGVVIVEVVIGKSGAVRSARVLKPLPMGLSEAAIEAARTWLFEPARIDGEPVAVYYNVSSMFLLPEGNLDRRRPETVEVYDMPDDEAERQTGLLSAGRVRWRGANVHSYDLATTCGGRWGSSVRVREDEVIGAGLLSPWPVTNSGDGPNPPRITVEDLFALVERAIFQRVNSLEVEYDAELGFPRSIRIDLGRWGQNMARLGELGFALPLGTCAVERLVVVGL